MVWGIGVGGLEMRDGRVEAGLLGGGNGAATDVGVESLPRQNTLASLHPVLHSGSNLWLHTAPHA